MVRSRLGEVWIEVVRVVRVVCGEGGDIFTRATLFYM